MSARASRIAKLLSGHLSCRWWPAPTPEMPAPTIRTSTCSAFISPGRLYGAGEMAAFDVGHTAGSRDGQVTGRRWRRVQAPRVRGQARLRGDAGAADEAAAQGS